jgi:hypothetical protein
MFKGSRIKLGRSGRLWPEELDAVISRRSIRSIISLVPTAPTQTWYRGELAVSSVRNLVRYEMPLSPQEELSSEQLRDLLALLREAPKPVLIHSESGADRSGLAAAIFKYAIAYRPVEEARKQLSIRYGHFPYLFWNGTEAMDASFRRFVRERREGGSCATTGLQIYAARSARHGREGSAVTVGLGPSFEDCERKVASIDVDPDRSVPKGSISARRNSNDIGL